MWSNVNLISVASSLEQLRRMTSPRIIRALSFSRAQEDHQPLPQRTGQRLVRAAMQTNMARAAGIVFNGCSSKKTFRDGNDQGHPRVRRLHSVAPSPPQGDRGDARLVQSGAEGPGQGRARLLQLG